MLQIRDISVVPREDWTYVVEQTGVTISTKNYYVLYPKIVEHCKSNNVPVPSEQDVINYLCEHVTIPCYEGMTPLVNRFSLNLPSPLRTGCCGQVKLPK